MLKYLGIILIFCQYSFSQEDKSRAFDFVFESVLEHHRTFDYKIHKAYINQDYAKVDALFEDFIEDNLHNKIMNDFYWNKFRSRYKSLYDIDLPVYLLTRSSWSLPSVGEVPAVNKLAKKYKNQIKFVVLFWDSRQKMKSQGRKYSRHVEVVYIDELKNKDSYTIKALKHVLGVPVAFIMDEKKHVLEVNRPEATPFDTKEDEAELTHLKHIEKQVHHVLNKRQNLISEKSAENNRQ
ncbi:MAG: hypothetical protein L0J45_02560 [Psychroflexus sp.]|nr:hypothetical protein [Psychroflexus sp.]MDN6310234.1 hypothetical protein [Psychroflexus sp.]